MSSCRVARALVANLPAKIGGIQVGLVQRRPHWRADECRVEVLDRSPGPGNALLLEIEFEHVTELMSAFGEKEVRAGTVAEQAIQELERYLEHGAPVGEHLASPLVLPLVLARGGGFVTGPPSSHMRTEFDVVRRFVDVPLRLEELGAGRWRVAAG